MKILDKEYEEISRELAEELPTNEFIIVTEENKSRYFREVKPAPEFPIRIATGGNSLLKIYQNKSVNHIDSDGERNIILGEDCNFIGDREQDINGILKALLYLETEDDIIKRLKELR